jgi:hypothetical protein
MQRWFVVIATIVPLSVGVQVNPSGPQDVTITFRNGQQMEGEILVVRDSVLLFCGQSGMRESELRSRAKELVLVLKNDVIQSVETISRNSYVGTGILVGVGLGCVTGCIIGNSIEVKVQPQKNDTFGCNAANEASEEKSRNMLDYGLGVGLGGGILGGVIGSSMSTKREQFWVTDQVRNFRTLTLLARYPASEPDFLKEIGR